MNTLSLLDKIKEKNGLRTDAELADVLNCSTAQISQYRTKKRIMDDYTAAKLAEILGIDPMRIIAQANAEREKNEEKRAFWMTMAKTACITSIILGTNFAPSQNAHNEGNAHPPYNGKSEGVFIFSIM
jgi:transcriptional regulator with XRE-family HTH domain